ncbi:hypothetical protein C0992_012059 [Termitomyces sp. T32_za158]|nr:hypothetical protein C0992_012059 [Termitomyces sp. T32_za158]
MAKIGEKVAKIEEKVAEREAKEVEREAKEAKREVKEAKRDAKKVEREAKEAEKEAKEAKRDAKEAERNAKEAKREAKEVKREAKEAEAKEAEAKVAERVAKVEKKMEKLGNTIKNLISFNRNQAAQIEDDANDALRQHLVTNSYQIFNTSPERCPCLRGKTLFEWDSVVKTQQGNDKVLWLVEAKHLLQEKHISKTIPTKISKTLEYIAKAKSELDLSKLPLSERKAAAQWATFSNHRLEIVIASPNITRVRAREILAAGYFCLRNTLYEPYQLFSPTDIDNFR